MRKFGTTKRNPNPPWPNQQSVVVIPPGSNPAAIGMSDKALYKPTENNASISKNEMSEQNEREKRMDPIMGEGFPQKINPLPVSSVNNYGIAQRTNDVTAYLQNQKGKYIKVEFLFGENIHMEKTGTLEEVGKDYIAVRENGTNSIIVCSTNRIKFINIFEYGK